MNKIWQRIPFCFSTTFLSDDALSLSLSLDYCNCYLNYDYDYDVVLYMFIFQMSFFNMSLSHFLLVSRLRWRDKLTQTAESSLYLRHVRKSNNGSFSSYRVSSIVLRVNYCFCIRFEGLIPCTNYFQHAKLHNREWGSLRKPRRQRQRERR